MLTCRRAVVVISFTALALAGCSSASSGHGSTAPSTSATSPGAPTTRSKSAPPASLTAPQAQAIARAGHLTAADLPGYTEKPGTNNQSSASDAELAKCLGVSLPTYVFHDPGVEFHKGEVLEVDSSVDSVATASEVKASVDAILSPKAPGCFQQQFHALMRQEGATKSALRMTRVPVHIRGADVTFGVRVSGTFVVQGTQARIRVYQLGAGVGQAEVAVSMVDAGVTLSADAPSEAQLRRLLQKSVARVVAAYPH